MVIIGLFDPSKVTAELLVHEDDARQLVRDADKLYYNMSEEDKNGLAIPIRLSARRFYRGIPEARGCPQRGKTEY